MLSSLCSQACLNYFYDVLMNKSDENSDIILDKWNENENADEDLLVEWKSIFNENYQVEESTTLSHHINKCTIT